MPKSLGKSIYGTGNHFEWGENQIIKLYGDNVPGEWVKELGQREKKLFESGFPVPEVGDLIEIEGKLGQVYERVDGRSIADELLSITDAQSAEISQLAFKFAETQAKIHSYDDIKIGLSKQKDSLSKVLHQLEVLTSDQKYAILQILEAIPEGDRVCHGDYHPYNVLLSSRGPIVIDWNNSHLGNPIEDVARSKLILMGFAAIAPPIREVVNQFNRSYIERYFQIRPESQEQMETWKPIVAAVRLADNIPEIQEWLLAQIRLSLQ